VPNHGVENSVHLVASHCKPWQDSSNHERSDGEGGLLLTPSIDHLFDRRFIGFEDSGDPIVSPVAHKLRPSMKPATSSRRSCASFPFDR
jgi:putative restriction endonuclease